MPKEFFGKTHYNMEEIAEMLGISYMTIKKYRREKKLNGVRIGRYFWFEEQELQKFVQGRTGDSATKGDDE